MATVFDLALATMYADVNIASAVAYTSIAGPTATIRAVLMNPQDDDVMGSLRVRSSASTQVASIALDVGVAAFAAAGLPPPARKDTVTVNGLTYEVRGVETDKQGIAYKLTLGRGES